MQDFANPSADDIRKWAADPNSDSPMEDWDLVVTDSGFEDPFVELIADPGCHKADFFLHCLYLWVYQAVRGSDVTTEVERLLCRGEVSTEPALRQWARRSRALIADPSRADRHLWWGVGQSR